MINNITIATADDVTTLSYDVNVYPVDLSGTINTLSNALNWLEKCSYFRPIFFFQFVVSHFGNSPMATECISSMASNTLRNPGTQATSPKINTIVKSGVKFIFMILQQNFNF